jgi:hypothetical protein
VVISLPNHKARAKQVAIKRSKQFAANNRGTAELRRFIREFEKFPADLRREIRPMLRKTGDTVKFRAQANFRWSTRIPSAIKVSVTFSKKTAGVRLTGNRRVAPHIRAYENLGREGFFRAPTGNPPEPWIRHRSRPGFFKAADVALTRDMDRKIGEIVDSVARQHGFR